MIEEIKIGKEDWLERQRVASSGGRIGYRFGSRGVLGSRGPGEQKRRKEQIRNFFAEQEKASIDKAIKQSPEGVLTEQIYPDSDAKTLDRPSKPEIITEPYDPYAPDSPTFSIHPNVVEFDDGTFYYKDTGEFYLEDGTQVEGPSKGAKIVPKTQEAREGGRIGFDSGQLVQPGPGRQGYGGDETNKKYADIVKEKGFNVKYTDITDKKVQSSIRSLYHLRHVDPYVKKGFVKTKQAIQAQFKNLKKFEDSAQTLDDFYDIFTAKWEHRQFKLNLRAYLKGEARPNVAGEFDKLKRVLKKNTRTLFLN